MTRIASVLALLLALAGTARAEDAAACDDTAGPTKVRFHIEMVDGHPQTVIDTKIVVCQKLPRPSVLYILESHHISYVWQNLELLHLMPRVLDSVKSAPF